VKVRLAALLCNKWGIRLAIDKLSYTKLLWKVMRCKLLCLFWEGISCPSTPLLQYIVNYVICNVPSFEQNPLESQDRGLTLQIMILITFRATAEAKFANILSARACINTAETSIWKI